MTDARPAGDRALLIEADGRAAGLAAAITRAGLAGIADVIPGARTVLVTWEPGRWRHPDLAAAIAGLPVDDDPAADLPAVEIPVRYDGPDLAEVAALAEMSVSEAIEAHQAAEYTVGWLGFSPGFGYLTGLDPRLARVPRLATPRVSVPAGSVAIAGGLAAVYPSASPGGWRLIGRTTARLWDPGRAEPSLLTPGRRVRFRADRADHGGPAPAAQMPGDARAPVRPAPDGRPASHLEIIRTGPLASVQDLGRPGLGAVGVPPSGAADPAALITANHLVGNPGGAAGLEFTLGRAAIRCDGDARLAVTGAPVSVGLAAPDGTERPAPFGAPFEVPGGWVVRLGAPAAGLRSYLAVTGGIATDPVLGSRSCDLLSGLGGGPLRPGDRLPVGPSAAGPGSGPGTRPDSGRAAGPAAARIPGRGETTRLRVLPGPRQDWFDDAALAALCGSPYTVTPASNRTGLRLDGPALPRRHDTELPSEGMATGSLQVPHDGSPILLLADHPPTGGYPVIAVVHSADLRLAGQLRPGDQVWFRPG